MSNSRIVQALWSLGRAGTERMVLDLARGLQRCGYEVAVAAVEDGVMHEEFRRAGIQVRVAQPGIGRLALIRFFEQIIHELHPAIWHTHLGADVWAGWAALRAHQHPWISTLHVLEGQMPWNRRFLRGIMLRRADHVVSISGAVEKQAIDLYQFPADHSSVIRLGIDTEYFSGASPHLDQEPLRFLSVGRLIPSKSQAVLLEALSRLSFPWELTLLGVGPDRARLGALADRLKISSHVHFAGSSADPVSFFQNADVFCFPSATEGQGLALIEAASCGLPIVASDLPVYREVFDASALIFVSEYQHPSAWTEAILRVRQDPSLMFEKAARAQKLAREQFSLDRMVSAYADLYTRLGRV